MDRPTISIITVTLNCARLLPSLIESLITQSDQDFEWVVIDGASTDGTLDVVSKFPGKLTVVTGHDFGIYDALNKGVVLAKGEYYLVVGADDRLYSDAISNFRKAAATTNWDIVGAKVDTTHGVLIPMRGKRWLRGGNAFVASHAVGTLIRNQLHEACGYYSNRYVNCADMHFILSAIEKSARIGSANFVAGQFGNAGVSTMDRICSLSDAFRIQLAHGENRALQLLMYVLRLFRVVFRSPT